MEKLSAVIPDSGSVTQAEHEMMASLLLESEEIRTVKSKAQI